MENRGLFSGGRFPFELTDNILRRLSSNDLANLCLVNRTWYQLTRPHVTKLCPTNFATLFRNSIETLYPNLRCLDLSFLDVVGDPQLYNLATALENNDKLTELVLRCGNGVTRRGFEFLGKCLPQIERLTLIPGSYHRCTMCESPSLELDSVAFSSFKNVEFLDFSWNRVTLSAIEEVASLSFLKTLSLKNAVDIEDCVIEEIASIHTLKVLNLSSTQVSDDGLMLLCELELEALNLSKCENLTDDGMYWLQRMNSLKKLDISSCPGITSAGIEHLTRLPNLKHLYLQDVKPIGSSVLNKIKVTMLSLRDCHWATDDTLRDLISCSSLLSINLRNCVQITDAGLRSLMQHRSLKCVNLRGCTQITDYGLWVMASFPRMEDLDLSFLNRITDGGLVQLSKARNLRRLVLDWCHGMTVDGLKEIRKGCRQLTELSIKGCHNMQHWDLVSLSKLPNLEKLDYEHSLCSVVTSTPLPPLRRIPSRGRFFEIC